MPCREHLTQLRRYEQQFEELEIKVSVFAFDNEWMAQAYIQETGLPWPVIRDPDRSLYHAYGMGRVNWWGIFGPRAVWQYLKLMFAGRMPSKPGEDWRQLGGNVLVDPQGIVQLHFVSKSPHDRPSIEQMLAIVRDSKSSASTD